MVLAFVPKYVPCFRKNTKENVNNPKKMIENRKSILFFAGLSLVCVPKTVLTKYFTITLKRRLPLGNGWSLEMAPPSAPLSKVHNRRRSQSSSGMASGFSNGTSTLISSDWFVCFFFVHRNGHKSIESVTEIHVGLGLALSPSQGLNERAEIKEVNRRFDSMEEGLEGNRPIGDSMGSALLIESDSISRPKLGKR